MLAAKCRRHGLAICADAYLQPTTTTTLPPPPTTTTTTTLPPFTGISGSYAFYGTLSSDPCGVAPSLSLTTTLDITEAPDGTIIATAGADFLTGTATGTSFTIMTGTTINPITGCAGDTAIGGDTSLATATVALGSECQGLICVVIYSGSLTLQ